jgi:hypothetical protein
LQLEAAAAKVQQAAFGRNQVDIGGSNDGTLDTIACRTKVLPDQSVFPEVFHDAQAAVDVRQNQPAVYAFRGRDRDQV